MGYGFIKANDGRDGKVFPSVVGEGSSDGGIGLSLGAAARSEDGENDLRITFGGKTYFLGELAVRHSRIAHRGLSATRAEGNDLKVLFLGALSLYCREPMNEFLVVTGLPPGRMHLADDLISRLKGDHTITRHQGGQAREYGIRLEKIEVVPQPLGTYWSEVLDNRGNLRADSRLLRGKIGVIDIGFRTTDFATIIDGEYATAWSRTVPIGISNGYDGISSALATQFGFERETYALDNAVIAGQISVSGRMVDITELRDHVFGEVATKLLVEAQSLWQLPEYDCVLITGGGGYALERYLRPHLPQSMLVNEPVSANARGYFGWGSYKQQQLAGSRASTAAAVPNQAQPVQQAQVPPQEPPSQVASSSLEVESSSGADGAEPAQSDSDWNQSSSESSWGDSEASRSVEPVSEDNNSY